MVIKFKYGSGCMINTSIKFFLVLNFCKISKSQFAKITHIIKLNEYQKQIFLHDFPYGLFLCDFFFKSLMVVFKFVLTV